MKFLDPEKIISFSFLINKEKETKLRLFKGIPIKMNQVYWKEKKIRK